MINLIDRKRETQTQQFIKIYQGLKSQGALDEEKIFETSVDLLQQQRAQMKAEAQEPISDTADLAEDSNLNLTQAFSEAKENTSIQSTNQGAKHKKTGSKNTIGGINIQNLFKD